MMQAERGIKEIVFASGSRRRAYMIAELLAGRQFVERFRQWGILSEADSQFPINPVAVLGGFFNQHVYNGDGAIPLGEKLWVGGYQGLPVYVQASTGETPGNIALHEAANKSAALAHEAQYYHNPETLFIGIDTVDSTPFTREPLGKPENHPHYKLMMERSKKGFGLQALIKKAFQRDYLDKFYPVDAQLTHQNGIAVSRWQAGELHTQTQLIKLHSTITPEIRANLQVLMDCGGGGIFQQTINWLADDFSSVFGGEVPTELRGYSQQELVWTIYCQIIGMPLWAVKSMIDAELAQDRPVVAEPTLEMI